MTPASLALVATTVIWQVLVETGLYFPKPIYIVPLFLSMLPGQLWVIFGIENIRPRSALFARFLANFRHRSFIAWLAALGLYAVYFHVRFQELTSLDRRTPSLDLDSGQCVYREAGGRVVESFPGAMCAELQTQFTSAFVGMIGLFALIHFLAFRYLLRAPKPFLFGGQEHRQ